MDKATVDTAIDFLDKYKVIALSLGFVSAVVAIGVTQGIKGLIKLVVPALPASTVWLLCAGVSLLVFNVICRYSGQDMRDFRVLAIGLLSSFLAPVAVGYARKKYGFDLDDYLGGKPPAPPPPGPELPAG